MMFKMSIVSQGRIVKLEHSVLKFSQKRTRASYRYLC